MELQTTMTDEVENHQLFGRYLRIILWATVVLFVTALISVVRSFHIEHTVDKLDVHTTELTTQTISAREAAIEARDALKEALADFEERRENATNSPEAIQDALEAVHRIEMHLCGGPCDP
jgi:hypothetical protein